MIGSVLLNLIPNLILKFLVTHIHTYLCIPSSPHMSDGLIAEGDDRGNPGRHCLVGSKRGPHSVHGVWSGDSK